MFKYEYELLEVRQQGLARLQSLRESTRALPGGRRFWRRAKASAPSQAPAAAPCDAARLVPTAR